MGMVNYLNESMPYVVAYVAVIVSFIIGFLLGKSKRKLLIITLFLGIGFVNAGQIGCENIPGFLHCFNLGKVAPDTYYNISSGFMQHANDLTRVNDVRYVYGYGQVGPLGPVVYGTDITPNILKNASDNLSYYWADSEYTQTQGANVFTLHKNHSQNLSSDYVQIDFSFKASRRITGNNWFFHSLKNLDVAQDGQEDMITYIFENGSVETFYANDLGNFSRNVSKVVIDGGVGTYSYVLDFGRNVTLWYTTGTPNGELLFGEYIGTIIADQTYKYSYSWIDATCTATCVLGASYTVTDGGDFNQIYEYETKDRGCKYTVLRPIRGSNCTFSADCNLQIQKNITSSTFTTITSTDSSGLRCANMTSASKKLNTLKENSFYSFNLSGWLVNPNLDYKMTMTRCYIDVTVGDVCDSELEVTTNATKLNVTIWTPPNNTIVNNNQNWTVFACNRTGPAPSYTTLLLNDSLNKTQVYIANLSQNVSFDYCGNWSWTCQACKFGHCHYAWNGNWSYTFNNSAVCPFIFVPPGLNQTPYNPILDSDYSSIENWLVYAIAFFIAGIGVLILIVTYFRRKRYEDVEKYSKEP